MAEMKVKDKEVVIPGELLAEGMGYLPSFGTYREGEKIYAAKLGLLNVDGKVLKLVSLKGRYLPRKGDVIIGQVTDILMTGWRIDTNSAYSAVLSLRDATTQFIEKGSDLRKFFAIGDYIMAKVTQVTSQNLIDLSTTGPGLRKLMGGRIITVNPHKVPRIIGKQGSMVSMIKDSTGCRILVGQNGRVWIQGDDSNMELLTVNTIRKIEEEAHISGLTDRIKTHLESAKK